MSRNTLIVAIAVTASLISVTRSASATVTTLTSSPTWNDEQPWTEDVYYGDTGAGVMFTVNAPAGKSVQVESLGRFFFGAGTYYNNNGFLGPYVDNSVVRTLTLAKVTNPGIQNNYGNTDGAADVVARVSLNPALNVTPIYAGTQVGLNFGNWGKPQDPQAVGGWQYAALDAPVLLEQGATYIITSDQIGYLGDPAHTGQVYGRADASHTALGADFTWVNSVTNLVGSGSSVNFLRLGANYGTYSNIGPVNLLFEEVVPEPSTIGLISVASVALLRRKRNA
jgi:hypothetical protein